jgi:hypothetical protein
MLMEVPFSPATFRFVTPNSIIYTVLSCKAQGVLFGCNGWLPVVSPPMRAVAGPRKTRIFMGSA